MRPVTFRMPCPVGCRPALRWALALLAVVGGSAAVLPAHSGPAGPAKVDGLPARVVMSRQDCLNLVRHRPDPDVTYRPGVDVNGNAVAPADLPSSAGSAMAGDVVIDLKRPLGQTAQVPPGVAGSDLHMGVVSVDLASGQVLVNGRPIDSESETIVLEACRRAGLR